MLRAIVKPLNMTVTDCSCHSATLRDLADAILHLLDDLDKGAAEWANRGARWLLERFDEQLVFEKVKAEYATLLSHKELQQPAEAYL